MEVHHQCSTWLLSNLSQTQHSMRTCSDTDVAQVLLQMNCCINVDNL